MKIETMKTDDLIPYARNSKEHPEAQINQIAASIQEFGMNDPVAIWHDKEHNPIIVEGHGRVLALQKLRIDECPTISLDNLTDEQRRAYTLVHNQLTMNTGFNPAMLVEEVEELGKQFDLKQYDITIPKIPDDTDIPQIIDKHAICIDADDEADLQDKFDKLTAEGYECRIITI